MFKKVLILSAAVGAGHLRAAEAFEKAFACQNAAEEVSNIDVLNYTNRFAQMKHNVSKFAHPNSAEKIVRKLSAL